MSGPGTERLLVLIAVAACSKAGGQRREAPALVVQELSTDALTVKGPLPEGWTRRDPAEGGVRLASGDADSISIAREAPGAPAKDRTTNRADLERSFGAGHVINSGVEIVAGRFGYAVNLDGPGTASGAKRVEAHVYWDTAGGVVSCTVVMAAPSAEAAYTLCRDLEVTLK